MSRLYTFILFKKFWSLLEHFLTHEQVWHILNRDFCIFDSNRNVLWQWVQLFFSLLFLFLLLSFSRFFLDVLYGLFGLFDSFVKILNKISCRSLVYLSLNLNVEALTSCRLMEALGKTLIDILLVFRHRRLWWTFKWFCRGFIVCWIFIFRDWALILDIFCWRSCRFHWCLLRIFCASTSLGTCLCFSCWLLSTFDRRFVF